MNIRMTLRRGALAAAMSALLVGAAFAGQTPTDTTRIEVRTQAGAIERVTLADLKVGEIRSFTTESGSASVAKRTATGLDLQISGETFAIDMPDPAADGLLAHDGTHEVVVKEIVESDEIVDVDGKEVVVLRKHHGDAGLPGDGKRVVVRHERHGDPTLIGKGDAAPSLADPGNEGKRILVMRTLEKRNDGTSK